MDDRIPLLLLPGLLLDERLYKNLVDALGDMATIQVADLTQDDTIAGMAKRALAAAPERFALCGLSMGGYVALEIMRLAPARVERLALLNTQARPDAGEARERRLSLMDIAEQGRFDDAVAQLLRLFVHEDRLADEDLMGALESMAQSVGKDAFLRQQSAIMSRIDSRPSLAAINCPTMVLGGRQDALMPPHLHEELAAAIPNAALIILPHCGHLSPLEQPVAVTTQLRAWLA
ncbi:MAG: alpha/beta fold hydrolase [Rhodomicrobiaceae bacterium]